jgi:hypothetical protein
MKKTLAATFLAVALVAAGCSSASESPDAQVVPHADASTVADAATADGPLADADVNAPDAAEADADTAAPDADLTADADLTPDADVHVPDATIGAPDGAVGTPDATVSSADAQIGPVAVSFGAPTMTPQFGNPTGGSAFPDTCPAGQALIGLSGSLTMDGGFHRQINGQCGSVTRTGSPGSYVVHTGPGLTMPVRGVLNGTFPWARFCPADSVVSGFVGRSGLLVDQITLSCTALSANPDTGALVLGMVTVLAPAGGGGGTAFAQTSCAAGQLATVANLRAGDGVDAFGIGCSTATLP